MPHFVWYAFCASSLAVCLDAPFGRPVICDCQVCCCSALFSRLGAPFGSPVICDCRVFCASSLAVFLGAPFGSPVICDCRVFCCRPLFSRRIAPYGRVERFKCPVLSFCIQAHPESKTLRRQPFSLFVDPFFLCVSHS